MCTVLLADLDALKSDLVMDLARGDCLSTILTERIN